MGLIETYFLPILVAAIAIGMTSEYWWEVLKKLVMKQRKFFEEAGEEAAAEILADLFKPLFVGGVAFLSANVYGLCSRGIPWVCLGRRQSLMCSISTTSSRL